MSTDFVENDRLCFPQIAPPEFGNDPQNVPVSRRPLAIFCEIRSKTKPVLPAAKPRQTPRSTPAALPQKKASQSSCARRRRKKLQSVFFQDMCLEKDTSHEKRGDNSLRESRPFFHAAPHKTAPPFCEKRILGKKAKPFSRVSVSSGAPPFRWAGHRGSRGRRRRRRGRGPRFP